MCTRILIEHSCKHRVFRGNTRCYNESCTERKEIVRTSDEVCPQCEARKVWRSARWCPEGCRCTVM